MIPCGTNTTTAPRRSLHFRMYLLCSCLPWFIKDRHLHPVANEAAFGTIGSESTPRCHCLWSDLGSHINIFCHPRNGPNISLVIHSLHHSLDTSIRSTLLPSNTPVGQNGSTRGHVSPSNQYVPSSVPSHPIFQIHNDDKFNRGHFPCSSRRCLQMRGPDDIKKDEQGLASHKTGDNARMSGFLILIR